MIRWKDFDCDLQSSYKDGTAKITETTYKLLNNNINSNGIRVTIRNGGEDFSFGLEDTVDGYVLCSDGNTYQAEIVGKEGNKAWFIVPPDAYLFPGPCIVSILVVTGTVQAVVLAARMSIEQVVTQPILSPSSVVANISNVESLLTTLVAAKEEAEEAAENVGANLAPAYANGVPYTAGDYITDSGVLYRVTADIAAADNTNINAVSKTQVTAGTEISDLKSAIDLVVDVENEWNTKTLSVSTNGYYDKNGDFNSNDNRAYAFYTPVEPGEKYKLSTRIGSTQIPCLWFMTDDTLVSYDSNMLGNGTNQDITDYEFTVPNDINKLLLQSTSKTVSIVLKKYEQEVEYASYLKSETYNKAEVNTIVGNAKYGIKWNVSNNDDLGSRCFDAVGLSATIGVGATDGSSDFDTIYPWSGIKRCNIKKTANGAEIITFEGETGFALDGTNGDVFVRIPKFSYDRYVEDGYEYRVIYSGDSHVHPAFIENGKVLDEIFIGAYEAYVSEGKLRSIAGVIPSSNLVASTFLADAKANGANYSLYDSRCVDAVWNLMAIEYGKRNTNQIIGYGYADFAQPVVTSPQNITVAAINTNTVRTPVWNSAKKATMPVGSNITVCGADQYTIITQAKLTAVSEGADYMDWTFDGDGVDVEVGYFIGSAACTTGFCESVPSGALDWHTGRANWIENSTTRNPTRYRWMENLIGSVWAFLPDISFNNLQMYVCTNMADYEFGKTTGAYLPVGNLMTEQTSNGNKTDIANANYWITGTVSDYFNNAIPFGKTYDTSLTSTKAFGAYYYLQTGNKFISNGGGFDHLYRCNMLTNRAWQDSSTKRYLYGARLMYKHLV